MPSDTPFPSRQVATVQDAVCGRSVRGLSRGNEVTARGRRGLLGLVSPNRPPILLLYGVAAWEATGQEIPTAQGRPRTRRRSAQRTSLKVRVGGDKARGVSRRVRSEPRRDSNHGERISVGLAGDRLASPEMAIRPAGSPLLVKTPAAVRRRGYGSGDETRLTKRVSEWSDCGTRLDRLWALAATPSRSYT